MIYRSLFLVLFFLSAVSYASDKDFCPETTTYPVKDHLGQAVNRMLLGTPERIVRLGGFNANPDFVFENNREYLDISKRILDQVPAQKVCVEAVTSFEIITPYFKMDSGNVIDLGGKSLVIRAPHIDVHPNAKFLNVGPKGVVVYG